MDKALKLIRRHKLALLAATVFVYAAKFACNRSTLAFEILVLIAGVAILVAIYRWEPVQPPRYAKLQKPNRRKKHR